MAATPITHHLPAGYTLRAPRLDDITEVVQLINARSLADMGRKVMSEDILRLYWQEPDRDLNDDDWLVVGPDGQIVAFMELYVADPFIDYEFDLYVLPGHENAGIETVLLETLEARARRDLHRAPEGARVVLRGWTPSTATGWQRELENYGFSHIRDGLQMLIDLDEIRPIEPIDGITFRPFELGQDDRAIWEVSQAAFADHWGHIPMPYEEFHYYHIESDVFDRTLWYVAEADGAIVGYAICRHEHAGYENTGWVSSLGVRREYRGRGVGRNLLLHVFNEFYRRGYAHVGLGVDASSLTGADRLYRSVGMREVAREYVYEKVVVEGHDPRPS